MQYGCNEILKLNYTANSVELTYLQKKKKKKKYEILYDVK